MSERDLFTPKGLLIGGVWLGMRETHATLRSVVEAAGPRGLSEAMLAELVSRPDLGEPPLRAHPLGQQGAGADKSLSARMRAVSGVTRTQATTAPRYVATRYLKRRRAA